MRKKSAAVKGGATTRAGGVVVGFVHGHAQPADDLMSRVLVPRGPLHVPPIVLTLLTLGMHRERKHEDAHKHKHKHKHECPDASSLDDPGNKAVNADRNGTRAAAQVATQATSGQQPAARSTGKRPTA